MKNSFENFSSIKKIYNESKKSLGGQCFPGRSKKPSITEAPDGSLSEWNINATPRGPGGTRLRSPRGLRLQSPPTSASRTLQNSDGRGGVFRGRGEGGGSLKSVLRFRVCYQCGKEKQRSTATLRAGNAPPLHPQFFYSSSSWPGLSGPGSGHTGLGVPRQVVVFGLLRELPLPHLVDVAVRLPLGAGAGSLRGRRSGRGLQRSQFEKSKELFI